MILVDTSVLIGFFRSEHNRPVEEFERILDLKIPFGITECIYQEILQGAVSPKDYQGLKRYLDTVRIYSVRNGKETYAEAARLFMLCRAKGITIRSSIDCLIVQIAIEHKLSLLHNDRDFDHMAKVIPALESVV